VQRPVAVGVELGELSVDVVRVPYCRWSPPSWRPGLRVERLPRLAEQVAQQGQSGVDHIGWADG